MTTARKKLVSIAIGIAISIAALWAVFGKINLGELVTVLQRVNYWWLLPNILLVIFSMYQRAIRWQYMLKPIKRVAYGSLLASTCVGFMANNVLPARLGEFVRAYSLASQDRSISKSASMATIFVERMVFDLAALLLIFGAVILFSTIPFTEIEIGRDLEQGTYLAVAVVLVGLAFVLFLAIKPVVAGRLLVSSLFFLPVGIKTRIQEMVMRFSDGLLFMKDWRNVFWVGFHTLWIWLFLGLSNYFVFLAFNFDLPVSASYVMLVIVSIFIFIPSSPGFVGVYHYSVAVTLALYAIPKEEAGAFALVLHAAQYLPITAMGFYYLKKKHLSLKTLETEAVQEI
jgi:hypothetical protein